jgi:hypothetical protein
VSSITVYILAALAIVFFLIAAVVALTLDGGPGKETTPAIATIIGLAGPLLTTLILLIRGEQTNKAVQQTKTLVDNHINGDSTPTPPTPGA